ncbi:MAG: hypothetical protein JWR61_1922 [Ferruginibacter sp.]|uniref:hypothetical protein n=1 Tax=Ferruginibacter sp. TaxID=1940288 RepID=UPI0026590E09|nr:hypothetical protein [Ferruginibacter sp.]MDB5276967.1 hypothetical protein [Ferruginibacter sp.]
MRKYFVPTFAVFITFVCMGMQCNKSYDFSYTYNFVEKVNLFPAQKTYKTGDTIWIQYTNPDKKLFDKNTGQLIAADSVALSFNIAYQTRFVKTYNPPEGYCDFISASGINADRTLYDNSSNLNRLALCNADNTLNFKVAIVPKQTGIFSLYLATAAGGVAACANRSTIFPFSSLLYKFNLTDCNKDVYLSIPVNSRGESPAGATESLIDSKQVFVFKVE